MVSEVGPYRLVGLYGRGASAVVHRGFDSRDGHAVAVKILHRRHLRPGDPWLDGFLAEARLFRGLSHPALVRIEDAGVAAGAPFIVMEPVDGECPPALGGHVEPQCGYDQGGGCPRPPQANKKPEHHGVTLPRDALVGRIAQGLAVLHRAGFVHRDVKPSNIRLRTDGQAVLMDFGTAVSSDHPSGLIDRQVGTPRYLAPELPRGAPATPASDIYALGVVLRDLGGPPDLAAAMTDDNLAIRPSAAEVAARLTPLATRPWRRLWLDWLFPAHE